MIPPPPATLNRARETAPLIRGFAETDAFRLGSSASHHPSPSSPRSKITANGLLLWPNPAPHQTGMLWQPFLPLVLTLLSVGGNPCPTFAKADSADRALEERSLARIPESHQGLEMTSARNWQAVVFRDPSSPALCCRHADKASRPPASLRLRALSRAYRRSHLAALIEFLGRARATGWDSHAMRSPPRGTPRRPMQFLVDALAPLPARNGEHGQGPQWAIFFDARGQGDAALVDLRADEVWDQTFETTPWAVRFTALGTPKRPPPTRRATKWHIGRATKNLCSSPGRPPRRSGRQSVHRIGR